MSKTCHDVHVIFKKPRKSRTILDAPLVLCEKCITEFLKAFGQFKNEFMAEQKPVKK
jgi:hypothetical protein